LYLVIISKIQIMPSEKNQAEKTRLHPRNKNRSRYDLEAFLKSNPKLSNHIKPNKYGTDSIDFSNPIAVKVLNKSLLHHYYGIEKWEFPNENLCPPIPGRADYIHYIADLLAEYNSGIIPEGEKVKCFDIGAGASCIYPIIGTTEYNWNFIASDINSKSISSSDKIIQSNPSLQGKIDCRLQENKNHVFYGILGKEEKIDISICNPPFHSSLEKAKEGTRRKIKNLSGKKTKNPKLNFAGIHQELICEGGEYKFITNMVRESRKFAKNCFWFTTLVSKKSNLKGIYKALQKSETFQVKTIPMGTGNKTTRIIAWTFLSRKEQEEWKEKRWK